MIYRFFIKYFSNNLNFYLYFKLIMSKINVDDDNSFNMEDSNIFNLIIYLNA